MAGTMTVAKRKVSKPAESGRKPTALTIKGSLEWRAWVEKGAAFCRTDVAKLVDASLIDYLKSRGFDDEPPVR